MSASNWVTGRRRPAVRFTSSAACAARATAAAKSASDTGPSPTSIALAERAPGAARCSCPVRSPWRSRIAAHQAHGGGLAVGAHHVDRREAAAAACPSDGHQLVHAVEPEAHAEQLEVEQVLLGLAQVTASPSVARSASRVAASQLARARLPPRSRRRLARRSCSLRACPRRGSISLARGWPRSARWRRSPPRCRTVGGAGTLHHAARASHRAATSPSSDPPSHELEARRGARAAPQVCS